MPSPAHQQMQCAAPMRKGPVGRHTHSGWRATRRIRDCLSALQCLPILFLRQRSLMERVMRGGGEGDSVNAPLLQRMAQRLERWVALRVAAAWRGTPTAWLVLTHPQR